MFKDYIFKDIPGCLIETFEEIQTRMINRTGHSIDTIKYEVISTFKRICSCRPATFINGLYDTIMIFLEDSNSLLEDYRGSKSSGDLLMTIIYLNFKPMGNLMAQKLKANNLKRRKILQYDHSVSTDESHQTT